MQPQRATAADYVAPPQEARECASCALAYLCDPAPADAAGVIDASAASWDLFHRCTVACTIPDCQQSCAPSVLGVGAVDPSFYECNIKCGQGEYWACLDEFVWPDPLASTAELEFFAGPQFAGATALVCAQDADGGCTTTLADASVDEAGSAIMRLPLNPLGSQTPGPGANGEYVYLFMPSDDAGTLVPTLTYWGFPLSQPQYSVGSFNMSRDQLNGLLGMVGLEPKPGHGHIAAVAYDCRGVGAKNVTVQLRPMATETVAVDYPSPGPAPGDVTQPSSNLVSFANVPVSPNVHVRATIEGGTSPFVELPVVVRDGEITVVNLMPQQTQ